MIPAKTASERKSASNRAASKVEDDKAENVEMMADDGKAKSDDVKMSEVDSQVVSD